MQTEIFDPLAMGDTTFAWRALSRATTPARTARHRRAGLRGEHGFQLHVDPIDRPAALVGSATTSSATLGDELDQGRLPDGRRLVSARTCWCGARRAVATARRLFGMGGG